jgi:hypothetical protein
MVSSVLFCSVLSNRRSTPLFPEGSSDSPPAARVLAGDCGGFRSFRFRIGTPEDGRQDSRDPPDAAFPAWNAAFFPRPFLLPQESGLARRLLLTKEDPIERRRSMVARLTPAQIPVTLTQENHPENQIQAETEKQPTLSLASAVGIGALCSLVGMTLGSAALSTAFQADTKWEVIFLLPLVGTAVSLLGGWIGAFFHMIRADAGKKGH